MQQRAQRAPPDHQPRDERAELLGREEVDLEHARVVRADRAVPELVDAEFGDCVGEGGVSERVGGNRELGGGGDRLHSRRMRSQSSVAYWTWVGSDWRK